MLTARVVFQLSSCLFVVAGVTADTTVPLLELDVIDDAFESELRDYNLYRVTPLEDLVVSNIHLLEKSGEFGGGPTVDGAGATVPHAEYITKRAIRRRARQVSASTDARMKKSIDQGNEEANLSNQLSNDNAIFDSDGSGDGQPDIAPIAEMPRSQQAEIQLTPESGYSPSFTIPKSRMNSVAMESTKSKAMASSGERDIAEANSAEESVTLSEDEKSATIKQLPSEGVETDSTEGETRMAASAEGGGNVSDDTLEISDQPDSRSPSGRALDEISGPSTQPGRDKTYFSAVNPVRTTASGNKSGQDELWRSNGLIAAPRPTKKTSTNNGSTFPLLEGEVVNLLKDNIAVLLGVILGVPVCISTCYMINHRRRRTGSMDITPVTSESSKQKMSSVQDHSRSVTCRTENELSTCPCQT